MKAPGVKGRGGPEHVGEIVRQVMGELEAERRAGRLAWVWGRIKAFFAGGRGANGFET